MAILDILLGECLTESAFLHCWHLGAQNAQQPRGSAGVRHDLRRNKNNCTKREKAIKRFQIPPQAEGETSAPLAISKSETRKGTKGEEEKKKNKPF